MKGGVKNDSHRFADSKAAGGAFTELDKRSRFKEKGEILLFLCFLLDALFNIIILTGYIPHL